jgi:multidrug efflux pump subunit AcrB
VWIVKLALRRPYTFVVMAVLMGVLGLIAILTLPKDIFPYINIPVISVVWSYSGISPQEMADRVVTVDERAMTTTVNDIEHMESTSYQGLSVIKVFFQPNVKVEMAMAQITALSQTILRPLPPGIFPPAIISYDASSVPILQIGLGSRTLSEQQLYDYGLNFIRTGLATVQGAAVPLPFGGKARAIMVDLDPNKMYSNHLSATDVSNAMNQQALILPAGTAKVGDREYFVRMNSSPPTVEELNDMPVKTVNGATIYMRDVAQVHDGYQVQQNIVRADGNRGTLLTVLKSGKASTLDIVKRVKERIPQIAAGLPSELKLTELVDQSVFVREAINGVLREGAIAAVLTGLMILLFLGSWRSTIIVCISIPLSILTSLIVCGLLGETINTMTLGGLALAVGILVDDATVEIENIHRNMGMKKPITRAILDGAQQIAIPAFVSTLAICIVFVPVLLLTGAAKYLFTPLAMAVVFAMLTSYLLTRTLVPTMAHHMLTGEIEMYQQGEHGHAAESEGLIWRVHHAFNRQFEKLRSVYRRHLEWAFGHRGPLAALFILFCVASMGLGLLVGRDFFPYVDSGQMRLHVRAPEGTRIEETERIYGAVEAEIRHLIPARQLRSIVDNIGLPVSGINMAYGDIATVGAADGEMLISLNENHSPTQDYERLLRDNLREKFPEETFFFMAANITNQILNFGIPSPIDIQVLGRNAKTTFAIAEDISRRVAVIPGAVDVHLRQQMSAPAVDVNVDRTEANQAGLTERDVANSMFISLSSSGQVAPNQWLNPLNGVSYQITVQTPQYRIDSFDALRLTPITGASGNTTTLLKNVTRMNRSSLPVIVNHYNVQPVFDVYANVDRRDLGGVAGDIDKILKKVKLPQGVTTTVRGQVETMESSFIRLGLGMLFAILLVYLLMVVNFQSWLDPFIILMAIPGALSGIMWMLFLTGTTLNVPSLMGCIMAIGVATANSILMVVFANDEQAAGKDARTAAISAGYTRIRPVIMTALAMIIGMAPMALSMGEGGEQNAPLGRAVIGGLILATFSTLFFVPIMYSFLRTKPPVNLDRQIEEEYHEGEGQQFA